MRILTGFLLVFAVLAVGCGDGFKGSQGAGQRGSGEPPPPPPPPPEPTEVNLAWDPVQSTPQATLGGYFIYVGTASGVYTNRVDVGNVTIAQITNLTVGETYYFAAKSYTTLGVESIEYSNEVSKFMDGTLSTSSQPLSILR